MRSCQHRICKFFYLLLHFKLFLARNSAFKTPKRKKYGFHILQFQIIYDIIIMYKYF